MTIRILSWSAFVMFVLGGTPAAAESPAPGTAVARGLEFIQVDAARWRHDKECASCHHGTMTVWALSEAKSRGYEVKAETFAENLQWTKDRLLAKIDEPRDSRPGWSMVNSSALNLAVMAWCIPEQDALSTDELRRIGGHLLRHQELDGSWAWSSAPAKNRPPPFFESDEIATLLGYAALYSQLPADATAPSEIRDARARAATWLATTNLRRRGSIRSEEHTSELQSLRHLVCRLLLEKKKNKNNHTNITN